MPTARPRLALTLLFLVVPPASAWAGPGRETATARVPHRRGPGVEIISPDRAETWVNGHTIRYVLLWDRRREALLAQITFDNFHEVDWQHPRREETFSFYLPGVARDAATGVFVTADGGVPVAATQRGGLGTGDIRPTPGTTIYVTKPDGQVRVTLTATPGSPAVADPRGGRWQIEGVVGVL